MMKNNIFNQRERQQKNTAIPGEVDSPAIFEQTYGYPLK